MNLLEEIAQELDKGAPWILYRQDLATILRRVAAHHQQPAPVECSCPHMDMSEPANNHSPSCPGRQTQQPASVSDYIATVPDNCDRIIWRGQYHHLPPHQPTPVVDDSMRKDAERYRWLRNPTSDVGLVIDKVTGEVPYHEGTHTGGYATYEYRAGDELDSAIDAALARAQGVQS